jgi:hypothetical protein
MTWIKSSSNGWTELLEGNEFIRWLGLRRELAAADALFVARPVAASLPALAARSGRSI